MEQPPVEAPPVIEAPVEEKTDDKKKDPKNKKKGKQVEVEAPPVVSGSNLFLCFLLHSIRSSSISIMLSLGGRTYI